MSENRSSTTLAPLIFAITAGFITMIAIHLKAWQALGGALCFALLAIIFAIREGKQNGR